MSTWISTVASLASIGAAIASWTMLTDARKSAEEARNAVSLGVVASGDDLIILRVRNSVNQELRSITLRPLLVDPEKNFPDFGRSVEITEVFPIQNEREGRAGMIIYRVSDFVREICAAQVHLTSCGEGMIQGIKVEIDIHGVDVPSQYAFFNES
ncbi:MAG: hypothetical protein AAFS07_11915 [Pseudomonadota bacterium]